MAIHRLLQNDLSHRKPELIVTLVWSCPFYYILLKTQYNGPDPYAFRCHWLFKPIAETIGFSFVLGTEEIFLTKLAFVLQVSVFFVFSIWRSL